MNNARRAPWEIIALCTLALCIPAMPLACKAEVHLQPMLVVGEEYSDNYFRSKENEASFWITQVSPGISAEVLTDRSRLDFRYFFSYFWHVSDDDRVNASSFDYAGHDLNLVAATQLLTRLTVGMDENYILTREPAYFDIFADIVNRSEYWRNRIEPWVAYDIAEKGEVKLSYRNEVVEYVETVGEPRENSVENRGILTLTYHINDRNHLDLENQYWHREYDGNITSDYDSLQSMLIFRREFNSYLEGHIGAGYHRREFEQSSLDGRNNFAFLFAVIGNTELSKLYFSFEHNFNDFAQGDNYFTAYRINLNGERLFFDKIRAYVGGYYQFSDYVDSPRQDDIWNLNVGVGYLFLDKRLELRAQYDYTDRDSNESVYDYGENRKRPVNPIFSVKRASGMILPKENI